jgi:virginiamycin B lyase
LAESAPVPVFAALTKEDRMLVTAALLLTALSAPPAGACMATADSVKIQEWKVPWERTRPRDPSVDKDGNIWFVGQAGSYIGRLDPKTGEFKKWDLESNNRPHNQIVDPNGSTIWYAGNTSGHIGRLDPKSGEIKQFPTPDVRDPHTMIFDKNGDIWFTAQQAGVVGRFSPKSGKYDVVRLAERSRPYGIVLDSQGRPWFDEFGTNKIGTIDPKTMELKEFTLPDERARPRRIAVTSDNMVWYGDYGRGYLGRLDPKTGKVDEWPLPGGIASAPYGMTSDDKDRIWVAEIGQQPTGGQGAKVRMVGFDPKDCNFFSQTFVPSGGGTVRYMIFNKGTREVVFGTDANTIGKFRVP